MLETWFLHQLLIDDIKKILNRYKNQISEIEQQEITVFFEELDELEKQNFEENVSYSTLDVSSAHQLLKMYYEQPSSPKGKAGEAQPREIQEKPLSSSSLCVGDHGEIITEPPLATLGTSGIGVFCFAELLMSNVPNKHQAIRHLCSMSYVSLSKLITPPYQFIQHFFHKGQTPLAIACVVELEQKLHSFKNTFVMQLVLQKYKLLQSGAYCELASEILKNMIVNYKSYFSNTNVCVVRDAQQIIRITSDASDNAQDVLLNEDMRNIIKSYHDGNSVLLKSLKQQLTLPVPHLDCQFYHSLNRETFSLLNTSATSVPAVPSKHRRKRSQSSPLGITANLDRKEIDELKSMNLSLQQELSLTQQQLEALNNLKKDKDELRKALTRSQTEETFSDTRRQLTSVRVQAQLALQEEKKKALALQLENEALASQLQTIEGKHQLQLQKAKMHMQQQQETIAQLVSLLSLHSSTSAPQTVPSLHNGYFPNFSLLTDTDSSETLSAESVTKVNMKYNSK